MANKQLWTATAFLLAGTGFSVSPWRSLWIAVPVWSLAVLVLGWVWRGDLWEWQQSLRRRPRWTMTAAQAVWGQDGYVTLGLYVHNPQRDGEFYGRVEETKGLTNTPRPPWNLRWRSTKSKHIIGFRDREIVDVVRFRPLENLDRMVIPLADPDQLAARTDLVEVELEGALADVAFRVVMRRANRRAVFERWVRMTGSPSKNPAFEVLENGEEPGVVQ